MKKYKCLPKKERNKVYVFAKEFFQRTLKSSCLLCGLCFVLEEAFRFYHEEKYKNLKDDDNLTYDYLFDFLPEFKKAKPKNVSGSYWWKLSDTNIRLEKLNEFIEKTK